MKLATEIPSSRHTNKQASTQNISTSSFEIFQYTDSIPNDATARVCLGRDSIDIPIQSKPLAQLPPSVDGLAVPDGQLWTFALNDEQVPLEAKGNVVITFTPSAPVVASGNGNPLQDDGASFGMSDSPSSDVALGENPKAKRNTPLRHGSSSRREKDHRMDQEDMRQEEEEVVNSVALWRTTQDTPVDDDEDLYRPPESPADVDQSLNATSQPWSLLFSQSQSRSRPSTAGTSMASLSTGKDMSSEAPIPHLPPLPPTQHHPADQAPRASTPPKLTRKRGQTEDKEDENFSELSPKRRKKEREIQTKIIPTSASRNPTRPAPPRHKRAEPATNTPQSAPIATRVKRKAPAITPEASNMPPQDGMGHRRSTRLKTMAQKK